MSAPDFSIAMARMFAVYDCHAVAMHVIRAGMDAEADPSAKAAIWDGAKLVMAALEQQATNAAAAFYKAKQEAGL